LETCDPNAAFDRTESSAVAASDTLPPNEAWVLGESLILTVLATFEPKAWLLEVESRARAVSAAAALNVLAATALIS
jgi:hypothetical protein